MFKFFIAALILSDVINAIPRCADVSMECKYREHLCTNLSYAGLMYKLCRSTCSWCQKNLDDVLHGRQYLAAPISNRSVENTTPEDIGGDLGTCLDTHPACLKSVALCQSEVYQSIMAKKCPKTCKTC